MIQWVVTSSILIIVVAVLRFLLRGKISLRLQYALWALVLVRLLVPMSFGGASMSVMNAVPESVRISDGYIRQSLDYQLKVDGEVVYRGDEPPSDEVFDELTEGKTYSVGSHTRKTSLELIWYAGMACVGVCLLASNLSFASRLRRSRRALQVESCALPVYVSEIIDTPCLFGLLRPTIYVTPAVAENETVLRHSIEHETTHFRHGDHIWAALRGLSLALHWYNPLVWLAAALSRRDAELSCDEATIKRLGESERMEYGRTLIGLTCQKRTALLLTATTMTGSKRGIKERITLIAKKPKMAIYTLIAVILIAAVAVGCTFTGAANDKDKPWTWMQNLSAEDIASASAWYGGAEAGPKLSGDDISELISILNSLERDNFSENKHAEGGTPEYGLAFDCDGGSYYINQALSSVADLELVGFGDSLWWIDSSELNDFINGVSAKRDEQTSTIEIGVEALIINALNSDGAYAEAALDALTESLMANPVETLEAIGAREEGVADFFCWSLAYYIRDMALDTVDALSGEGLSESGLYARERILGYFESDTPAPKSWRMVYLDFFDNELPALSEDKIVAVGLFDTHSDGVPELAVWYEASTDGALHYTDGIKVYQNTGSIYEGEPPEGVLRAQDGESIGRAAMNAFLNDWRP